MPQMHVMVSAEDYAEREEELLEQLKDLESELNEYDTIIVDLKERVATLEAELEEERSMI